LAAKVVPFTLVEYPEQRVFPEKTFDIFYDAGLADDDPCASVFRVRVVNEQERDHIRRTLRKRLAPRHAEGLIWFLDDHDWDAAFLIDGT
jgi:hypothetical protein